MATKRRQFQTELPRIGEHKPEIVSSYKAGIVALQGLSEVGVDNSLHAYFTCSVRYGLI